MADRAPRSATDNLGKARFEPAPGSYLLHAPGAGKVVQIGKGAAATLHFDLTAAAVPIEGTVVDAQGAACYADIWASSGPDVPATTRIAANKDGQFRVLLAIGAMLEARRSDSASTAVRVDASKVQPHLVLLAAGRIDGTVLLRATAKAGTASKQVALLFDHPNDASPQTPLQVEVVTEDGQCLAHLGMAGAQGTWRQQLTLPIGSVRVRAHTASGLSAEAVIEVGAMTTLVRIPMVREAEDATVGVR